MSNHPLKFPTVINAADPEPVTPENPLVGLETLVLKTWLDASPKLARKYRHSAANRSDIENAVRLKVETAFAEELRLRSHGRMTQEQAEEFTRPAMWTPPTWS